MSDESDDMMDCLYPGECLMPGLHLRVECHTAEMMEEQIDHHLRGDDE